MSGWFLWSTGFLSQSGHSLEMRIWPVAPDATGEVVYMDSF